MPVCVKVAIFNFIFLTNRRVDEFILGLLFEKTYLIVLKDETGSIQIYVSLL